MIDKIWQGTSKLYYFLLPFSWLFGVVIFIRRLLYQYKILSSWRAPVPVIVVGNITVGGTGKTPMVIWLVEQLQKKGYHVGVVSRGYGGSAKNYPLYIDESTTPQEAGDEPVLIYNRTHVNIVVAPKRADAVKALLKLNENINIIITDDGLQHYALARDLELVVIDGQRGLGNENLLPAGPLRESAKRLKNVSLLILNGGNEKENHVLMKLEPSALINIKTNKKISFDEIKAVNAMAGIGNPVRFYTTLTKIGIKIIHQKSFSDHHSYNLKEIKSVFNNELPLIMTEKDAVKCRLFAEDNWWYLPVNASFSQKDETMILNIIQTKCGLDKLRSNDEVYTQ